MLRAVPYDATLAERVRDVLAAAAGVSERRMFGGLAFLVDGRIACAVLGEELLVRLGEEGTHAALGEPHTRPMDFTGAVSRSSVFVGAAGLRSDAALRAWVERGVRFARGRATG
jgi:TfoX/Sxy family transcriptional regulator of competence genes